MTAAPDAYPVRFDVEYPEGPRDRVSVAFRIILAIPILIVSAFLTGGTGDWSTDGDNAQTIAIGGAGILFFPTLLMIVFRQKYPRWWYDFNLQLTRFGARVGAYLANLRDEYPSTDEEQAIHVDLVYPDAERELNRWLPLVKWFLAIPHYIVLAFLFIAAFVVVFIAWFAILFTGQFPRGMFAFVVGVGRWWTRVEAYAFLLTTDKYPPFSLD